VLGILHQSVRTRRTVATNLSVIDRAYGAMETLVRDLECMHTFDSRAYLIVEVHGFNDVEEDGTSIAFPCQTPLRVSEHFREKPGLLEIAYLVGEDPAGKGRLRVFRRELEIETETGARAIRMSDEGLVLLVDGLTQFRMEFLSADEAAVAREGGVPEWVSEWEPTFGSGGLPVAVRLHVTAAADRGDGPAFTLERTVRLPVKDVATETLDTALKESLNL
jgi:hypothetical protein